ncbi:hypothetical protein GYB61_08280 [bacterium]|nr:hypothetical protein [bacterium]
MDRNCSSRIVGALAAISMAATMPAMATDYTVTTPMDVVADDFAVSLREAVIAANTNAASGDAEAGDADGDTISFALTAANITLDSPLTISEDLAIDGEIVAGGLSATISGGEAVQLFIIDVGAGEPVSFANIALEDGVAESGAALQITDAAAEVTLDTVTVSGHTASGADATDGGAIANAGTLTITGSTFTGNSVTGMAGSGGAINSTGPLDITGTSFSGNSSMRAGGAIEASGAITVVLTNVEMTDNTTGPNPGNGGGFHITNADGGSTVTVTGGNYSDNTAEREGGGLWNHAGTMTIDGGEDGITISGNAANGLAADQGGGGLFNNGGTMVVQNGAVIDANTATNLVDDAGSGSGGGILNKGGTLTVTGSTLSNNAANRAGGGIEEVAGDDAQTLTLTDVIFDGNTAGPNPGNGGALHVTDSGALVTVNISGGSVTDNIAATEGGGLWNFAGVMNIDDVAITGNAANGADPDNGGGGIFNNGGTVVITSEATTIADNTALGTSGSGGGIFNNNGTVSVTDATISGNVANRAGGGIEDLSNTAVPNVANPTVTLTNVTLDGNSAGNDIGDITGAMANPGNGGGLHITGDGDGVNGGYVIVSNSVIRNNIATEGGGLWNFGGPTTLDVSDSTFTANVGNGEDATNGGGALFNNGGILLVSGSQFMMNTASQGSGSGGALLADGGTVTITQSTFSGNSANRAGGAIEVTSADGPDTTLTLTAVTLDDNETGPSPGNGGGLHVSGTGNTITVDRSTVSNNTAANEGGGLWNFRESTMRVWNSTVFGNTADGEPGGGGIFNNTDGTTGADTTTLNVTIASNTASAGPGGGVLTTSESTFAATNTIIGDNMGMSANDVSGTVDGGGYNLVEDVSGATVNGPENITGMDASLSMDGLALNGGPTATVALLSDSPAIDAGLNSVCAGMAINNVDQRGADFVRPADGDVDGTATCDIGAYEVTDNPVATIGANGNTGNGSAMVTVTAGATEVAALGVSIDNNSGEALSVSGFAGTLSGSGDFDADITRADVVLDTNGNGMVDSGETPVGSATINGNAGTFSVSFSPARTVANGASENYVLAVDFGDTFAATSLPMLAGGSLLLLGLAGVSGFGRRKQLMLVGAIAAAAALSACNGDSTVTPPPVSDSRTFQFTLTSVDAQGQMSGFAAQPAGLPQSGPLITVLEQ